MITTPHESYLAGLAELAQHLRTTGHRSQAHQIDQAVEASRRSLEKIESQLTTERPRIRMAAMLHRAGLLRQPRRRRSLHQDN